LPFGARGYDNYATPRINAVNDITIGGFGKFGKNGLLITVEKGEKNI